MFTVKTRSHSTIFHRCLSVHGGGGGSLSKGGDSVQGRGLCPGGRLSVRGGLCQGNPPAVKSGWYASYWNAF